MRQAATSSQKSPSPTLVTLIAIAARKIPQYEDNPIGREVEAIVTTPPPLALLPYLVVMAVAPRGIHLEAHLGRDAAVVSRAESSGTQVSDGVDRRPSLFVPRNGWRRAAIDLDVVDVFPNRESAAAAADARRERSRGGSRASPRGHFSRAKATLSLLTCSQISICSGLIDTYSPLSMTRIPCCLFEWNSVYGTVRQRS